MKEVQPIDINQILAVLPSDREIREIRQESALRSFEQMRFYCSESNEKKMRRLIRAVID